MSSTDTGARSQPPGSRRPPFKSVFQKTSLFVANLTVLMLLIRGAAHFVAEARGRELGEALLAFGVELTIQVVVAVLLSLFFVALPLAGLIWYIQYLTSGINR